MRRICVYLGSSPGSRPDYTAAAERLAAVLAERGLGLVYGGAHVGTMGVIADAVLAPVATWSASSRGPCRRRRSRISR